MKYAFYDSTTGAIVKTYAGPRPEAQEVPGADAHITCSGNVRDTTHYIDASTPVAKDAMPGSWDTTTIAADGAAPATLSGLPTQCTVYVDGAAHAVTDGVFILRASYPGTYSVRVEAVRYLTTEWRIDAN